MSDQHYTVTLALSRFQIKKVSTPQNGGFFGAAGFRDLAQATHAGPAGSPGALRDLVPSVQGEHSSFGEAVEIVP